VAALADGDGSIDQRLVSLVRKELVRPDRPQLQGDDAYRFRHLLIRDAAYDALPKATRAELHARFADWLEHHGLQLIELDEVLGYHLEQAARYRRELGRPDAELEQRAAVRLGEAGSRAARRSDAHGAANLLQRAIALLAPDDPRRTQLLVALIGTLEGVAQPEEQFRWIDELEVSADPAARMHGRIARLQLRLMADPVEVLQQAETASEEALAVFAEVGDELGLAHTHYLVAWINWLQSRALPTAAAYDKVLEHARQAGAYTLLGQATVQQIGPLFHGPFTLEHVRSRLQRLEQDDSVDAHVAALFVGAELAERDGRFEDAHTLLDQANALNRELGQELGLAIGAQKHAEIFRSAGRLDDAAAAYREALARLEALGQTSFRSTTLINLGETLYLLGDRIGAERLAVEGEELGAAEDVVNFAFGRSLRARIAADRDDHQRGEQLAHEALQYAYKTDFPSVHAGAHEALAHVLAAAGRTDDARAELERALELWGTWCHQPNEQRVRELLREL
jgi:predicted ATPase